MLLGLNDKPPWDDLPVRGLIPRVGLAADNHGVAVMAHLRVAAADDTRPSFLADAGEVVNAAGSIPALFR